MKVELEGEGCSGGIKLLNGSGDGDGDSPLSLLLLFLLNPILSFHNASNLFCRLLSTLVVTTF